jgi:glycyl-tRNA synthetase
MSYGWIECVGHADRACYDLEQHAKRTGVALIAAERLSAPVQVERVAVEANKKLLGPKFKTEQKNVLLALETLSEEQVVQLQLDLQANGKGVFDCLVLCLDVRVCLLTD